MNSPDPQDRMMLELLRYQVEPSGSQLARLRAALVERAEQESLIDLVYRTVDSPYGSLLVVVSAKGVVRVAFEQEAHDRVLADLADQISPRLMQSDGWTDAVTRQLDEYFSGTRRTFDVALDLQLATGFRRTVLESLADIPYGATHSYKEVAAAVGNPRAMRAVGSACSNNPVPVVVPCHRVIRSDGKLGNYLGGVAAKVALLKAESENA